VALDMETAMGMGMYVYGYKHWQWHEKRRWHCQKFGESKLNRNKRQQGVKTLHFL
jgi:Spy/CpxP family protein refolding chaperone